MTIAVGEAVAVDNKAATDGTGVRAAAGDGDGVGVRDVTGVAVGVPSRGTAESEETAVETGIGASSPPCARA